MMGCSQMVAGAPASALVSYLYNGTAMPMIWMMALNNPSLQTSWKCNERCV